MRKPVINLCKRLCPSFFSSTAHSAAELDLENILDSTELKKTNYEIFGHNWSLLATDEKKPIAARKAQVIAAIREFCENSDNLSAEVLQSLALNIGMDSKRGEYIETSWSKELMTQQNGIRKTAVAATAFLTSTGQDRTAITTNSRNQVIIIIKQACITTLQTELDRLSKAVTEERPQDLINQRNNQFQRTAESVEQLIATNETLAPETQASLQSVLEAYNTLCRSNRLPTLHRANLTV